MIKIMKKEERVTVRGRDIVIKYKHLIPNKYIIVTMLFLLLVNAGTSLVIPYATMKVIDKIDLKNIDIKLFFYLSIFILFSMLMAVLTSLAINGVGEMTVKKLRTKLWEKIIYLPISFFDDNSTGELMSRLTNDTQVLRDFISFTLTTFITSIVTVVGSFILLWIIDWKIAMVLCISVPVATLIILLISGREYKISKLLQDTYASWQGDMHRIISDIRLVKASVSENLEIDNGNNKIEYLRKLNMKEAKISALIEPFSSTLVLLLLIINVGYGGLRVSAGTLTTGAFVATLSYLFKLTQPVSEIMQFFKEYQKFLGSFESIDYILSYETELQSITKRAIEHSSVMNRNSLCLNNVSFGYNKETYILKHITFEAKEGEITGIVGTSGAGKTTLFSLIERFYQPLEGMILYKGMNIEECDLYEWRKNIAYVFQDSPMMYGTILYNLTYGIEAYNAEDIEKAIDNANLRELINSLPNRLNTEIGDKGVKLSGGERQRLAIARAMIRNSKILLLDEATSHLDSESERLVQTALDNLMTGRTTIVIAHRLSTLKNASKLIVMENGTISGIGTHKELLQNNSLYKKFVDQQTKREL